MKFVFKGGLKSFLARPGSTNGARVNKKWQGGQLCDKCQPVVDHITQCLRALPKGSLDRKEIQHHGTGTALIASANSGCHLCSLFYGAVFLSNGSSPQEARRRLTEGLDTPLDPVVVEKVYSYTVAFSRTGGPPEAILELAILGPWYATNMVYVVPRVKEGLNRVGMSVTQSSSSGTEREAPFCGRTDDEDAFELAKWWLRKCSHEHPECQVASAHSTKVSPARLLDLSPQDGSIRVVTVSSDGEIPEYFALSYVWGTQDCIRLTTKSMTGMQQGIKLSELPRTIRDAVISTRALGCNYLWVDSLCIIQDSKEDWAAESLKMGGIYRQAMLTLAALNASGNHEGLFVTKNPLCARPFPIPGTDFEISNTANYFIWEYDGQFMPLQRRAWVIQERFSAIRTLYFGASGLYWECARCQASEWDVNGVLEPQSMNYKSNINDVLNSSVDEDFSPESYTHDFLRLWGTIRRLYTSANLTYESDRPIAIAGITKILSDGGGGASSHGIWLDIAPADLCWKARGDADTQATTQAPSWSWLSVCSSVEPLLRSDKYRIVWSESAKPVGYPPKEEIIGDAENLPTIPGSQALQQALKNRPAHSLSLLSGWRKVYLLAGNSFTLEAPPQEMIQYYAKNREGDTADDEDSSEEAEDTSGDEDDLADEVMSAEEDVFNPTEIAHHHGSRAEEDVGEATNDVVQADCNGNDPYLIKRSKSQRQNWPLAYEWLPDRSVDATLREAWFINLVHFESLDGRRIGEAGLIAALVEGDRTFKRLGIFKKWVFNDASMCNYRSGNGPDPRYLPPNPFARTRGLIRLLHLI